MVCCRQSETKRAPTPSLISSTLRKPLRKPLFTCTQECDLSLCTQLCLTSSQLHPYRKFVWEGGVPCEVTPGTTLFVFNRLPQIIELYIPQMEQYEHQGQMLLHLGNNNLFVGCYPRDSLPYPIIRHSSSVMLFEFEELVAKQQLLLKCFTGNWSNNPCCV